MTRILLILSTSILFDYNSYSQYFGFDYTPVQITGLPIHYLPSFAGNLGQVRLASESQIYNERGYYNRFDTGVSVDGFIPKISSGLGVTFSSMNYNDINFRGDYRYYNMGLAFAPKISVKGKYTLSPGVSITNSLNKYDGIPQTQYFATETISLLFNTKKIYVGAGFNSQIEKLSHWNVYFQIGATFQRSDESKFSFSPNLIWIESTSISVTKNHSITGLDQFYFPANVNLNFRYQKVLFGAGFYGFMAGFHHRNFRMMYTANGFLSRHTITLRFLFNNKEKRTFGVM